jgi:peptide/nickel transport system substrate-binding protein
MISDDRQHGLLVPTRRGFLQGAAAAGALEAFGTFRTANAQDASHPRRGGTFRMGEEGGSSTDSLDPQYANSTTPRDTSYMLFGHLVQVDPNLNLQPGLAESWEVKPGSKTWIFRLRQGAEFHNGKTITPDDVIFSINRHRSKDSKSLARGPASQIDNITADGKSTVVFDLKGGNADFPYLLAQYHFAIIPDGMTDFSKPVGSGAYVLKEFNPGVRVTGERFKNDWNQNRGWFDSVELIIINDSTARLNALLTGQVDAVDRIDRRTATMLENAAGVSIVKSDQGTFYTFSMNVTNAAFNNDDVRLALKFGFPRDQMLSVVLQGYGHLGNDHPVPPFSPWYNSAMPQRAYDPDRAKYHLKKAGVDNLAVQLSTSDAAFAGAVDTSELFQQAAQKAGIRIDLIREPANGYWGSVWRKKPFYISYWSGRPVPDLILTTVFYGPSASNEAFWTNEKFDQLLIDARAELDHAKRMQLYGELQQIASDDGGIIIPVFSTDLDAHSKRVMGFTSDKYFNMGGARRAERVWFAS